MYASGYTKQQMKQSILRVFDYDNSGTMDFEEYMLAINATNLNSPEDKLIWMFDVFDKDGGGTISCDEIKDLIRLKVDNQMIRKTIIFRLLSYLYFQWPYGNVWLRDSR